ncbi:MAG TPA: hypothetical protein VHY83_03690 [Solirubrobacteraceae bacterium]|jgi:hypothetical protein|nr:hypothetical protein [Solirubrobacteraceae bacterium]
MRTLRRTIGALALMLALSGLPGIANAGAEGGLAWRLEQPTLPGSSWPISLGSVGDIEFLEGTPNRGLLITSGNPPTIEPGVWAYNGGGWHELSNKCGAESEGRIAWGGPEEFWTVSDGRAGQASESEGGFERPPELKDNTLCHFAGGQIVGSYAHPSFQADSYQIMRGTACIRAGDCWFGGNPLPEPQIGAFHLHWNGSGLEAAPYPAEGHPVEDMRALNGRLYESVRVGAEDHVAVQSPRAPAIHAINPAGSSPTFEPEEELPLYETNELARALDFLHLSAADGTLWAAAGPKEEPGQVTVAIRQGGSWTQLIGPSHPLEAILPEAQSTEERQLLGGEAKHATVTAVAAEPGTNSAWIALAAPSRKKGEPERAVLIRVSSEGQVLEEQTLPSAAEQGVGIGPKGAAAKLACPKLNDCWLATTQGWLFHLAPEGERTLPRDGDPNFAGLITYRPPDQGLPQITPDAPPPDTSGLVEQSALPGGTFAERSGHEEAKVTLPLLSHLRSRIVHGNTLELTFHLAVKARIRLLAERKRRVIASTAMLTMKAGNRTVRLRLDPRRWPTKLKLQTHALAPLPVVSSVTGEGANIGTVSTGLHVLPRSLAAGGSGQRP